MISFHSIFPIAVIESCHVLPPDHSSSGMATYFISSPSLDLGFICCIALHCIHVCSLLLTYHPPRKFTLRFSHLTVLLDMYSSLTQSYGTMSTFLFNVLELERPVESAPLAVLFCFVSFHFRKDISYITLHDDTPKPIFFLFLQPYPSLLRKDKASLIFIYICIPRIIISLWAAFISYYWCAKNQIKRTGVALLMARYYYYAWDVLKF
jgi:hypothetical protein